MGYRFAVRTRKITQFTPALLSIRLLALLERIADHAGKQEVHLLRTTVRRLEVQLPHPPAKLAKSLKALRRKAGKVRDIDVHLDLLKSPLLPRGTAPRRTGSASAVPPAQRKLRRLLKDKRTRQLAYLRKLVDLVCAPAAGPAPRACRTRRSWRYFGSRCSPPGLPRPWSFSAMDANRARRSGAPASAAHQHQEAAIFSRTSTSLRGSRRSREPGSSRCRTLSAVGMIGQLSSNWRSAAWTLPIPHRSVPSSPPAPRASIAKPAAPPKARAPGSSVGDRRVPVAKLLLRTRRASVAGATWRPYPERSRTRSLSRNCCRVPNSRP